MSRSSIVVCTGEPIGMISPLLHGHFAEHLGRCCYDGLWVGTDSQIPNVDGFRRDVINALKRIGIPLLRWPGGCFADTYHWKDGIGPAEQRPRTIAESCGHQSVETNAIGTHEFIGLCQALGTQPYLAGNVGSGSPQELMDWVHYCNSLADTTLVRERIANGHPDSMGVRYWGVGNESWACGGNYDAIDYAREFKRFATFIKQIDQCVELVACGDHDLAWNTKIIEANRHHLHLLDHLSVHRYWSGGHSTGFTEAEYYQLQRGPDVVEKDIRGTAEIIDFFAGNQRHIGIAFDEWGVWHPDAVVTNDFEATSTMSDAVTAAGVFDVFNRWCHRLSMANIAQVLNVLQALIQTQGAEMWCTPTYHVFALYAPHRGAQSVKVDIANSSARDMPAVQARFPVPHIDAGQLSMLSASASVTDVGVVVSLSNRHMSDSQEVEITLRGKSMLRGELMTLAAAPNAHNSAAEPGRVGVQVSGIEAQDGKIVVILPPCSVQTLVLKG